MTFFHLHSPSLTHLIHPHLVSFRHGGLFQHSGASVRLPVSRNRFPPGGGKEKVISGEQRKESGLDGKREFEGTEGVRGEIGGEREGRGIKQKETGKRRLPAGSRGTRVVWKERRNMKELRKSGLGSERKGKRKWVSRNIKEKVKIGNECKEAIG